MFKNILVGVYLIIATLLDFVTTIYFTSFSHMAETNPVVKLLIGQNPLYFFAFKLFTIGFVFTAFYAHGDANEKPNNTQRAFRLTAYCCGTLWMVAGLWNTYLFYF